MTREIWLHSKKRQIQDPNPGSRVSFNNDTMEQQKYQFFMKNTIVVFIQPDGCSYGASVESYCLSERRMKASFDCHVVNSTRTGREFHRAGKLHEPCLRVAPGRSAPMGWTSVTAGEAGRRAGGLEEELGVSLPAAGSRDGSTAAASTDLGQGPRSLESPVSASDVWRVGREITCRNMSASCSSVCCSALGEGLIDDSSRSYS